MCHYIDTLVVSCLSDLRYMYTSLGLHVGGNGVGDSFHDCLSSIVLLAAAFFIMENV